MKMTNFLGAYLPISKKHFLICALLLLAAVTSNVIKPKAVVYDQERFGLSENIPTSFGNWRLDDSIAPVVLDPTATGAVASIYSDMVARTYVNRDGSRIMLSVAYGNRQTTRLKTHRQEVCYGAGGFAISNLVQTKVNVLGVDVPATSMIAKKGARTEPVIYWFTMGDSVVQGHLERLLVQLKYAVSGEIPEGYLVRVSSISDDSGVAYARQLQFLNELFAEIPIFMAQRLIGNRSLVTESVPGNAQR